MIILAFTVCLLSDPGRCQDKSLAFAKEELKLSQCWMGAQSQLAAWSNDHPDWEIRKFACKDASEQAANL